MQKITLRVYAKLNLTLDITGRDGGYHLLSSLCCSISPYDEITVERVGGETVTLLCEGVDCPAEKNIAYRAAKAFQTEYGTGGAKITVKKGIPLCGGLGGSSADAVGVLVALSRMYGKPVEHIVTALTSDGAFMLNGGAGLMQGRGERITPLPYGKLHFALITVNGGVSTAECFRLSDEMPSLTPVTDRAAALWKENPLRAAGLCKNELLPPAEELLPEIKNACREVAKTDAVAVSMSGSGSTVFGVYESEEKAKHAVALLQQTYPQAVYAYSVPYGVEIVEEA
ncbi:MAG: 4-(cytidine 5'-diphospho)-2-C-methyl-D-erythritol kinase [Clostridiales bacterium]|nr:4-(cytidine 5'-diphospho)-2-C-methyl-D-erythritol kinase [Clostridiales bacterium]